MKNDWFRSMSKVKKELEEYLKEFYFEKNDEKTRKNITEGIKKYLKENDVGPWVIEFKDGHKSFSVILKTDLELTYYIKGE